VALSVHLLKLLAATFLGARLVNLVRRVFH
jgi:hypothetical protein